MAKKTKKQPVEQEDKASLWQRRYKLAASNQEPMFRVWASWYKRQYNELDDSEMAPWRSKVLLPIVSSKVWSMIAKFLGMEPGFDVTVRNSDDDELPVDELERIAEKVRRKLEYDYHNPDLDETMRDKINTCLVDAAVVGTGLAKVPWKILNKLEKSHPKDENGEVDYDLDQITSMKIGYNDLEPVNIFNVFKAPLATNFQQNWTIIKEYKPLSELRAVNDEAGMVIYKNLDQLKGIGAARNEFAQYADSRETLTSEKDVAAADSTIDVVEIFECYDGEYICTYASQTNGKKNNKSVWVTLREQKNPFWHGKQPIVPFYVRKRPFSVWGESIYQVTDRMAAAADDLFNHYLDNWNLSIDGMALQEENSVVDDFLVEPGGTITYKNDKPEQWKFPEPNPNQLTLVMNELKGTIEQATISNYATGTPMSGLDKTQGTARGTTAILEAATDLIGYMRNNFLGSIKTIGEMWLSNNRQFYNFDFEVPTLKANQEGAEKLTPQELQLQMQLRIDDMDMKPISKTQQREQVEAYQANMINLQASSMQQAELTGDKTQILFLDYSSMADELARQYGVRSARSSVMPNDQALAVDNENAEAEELAAEDEAVSQEEDLVQEMSDIALEGADVPDEDVLARAEEALAQ